METSLLGLQEPLRGFENVWYIYIRYELLLVLGPHRNFAILNGVLIDSRRLWIIIELVDNIREFPGILLW